MTAKEIAMKLKITSLYVSQLALKGNLGEIKFFGKRRKRVFSEEDFNKFKVILEKNRQNVYTKKEKITQIMGRVMGDGLVKIYLHKNGMVYTKKHWLCTLEECKEKGVEIIN